MATMEERATELANTVLDDNVRSLIRHAYVEGANSIIREWENIQPKISFSSFAEYLDNNRPEGKMCLSNGECVQLDKAFKDGDWGIILKYAKKIGVI